jgi:hypothetical protein
MTKPHLIPIYIYKLKEIALTDVTSSAAKRELRAIDAQKAWKEHVAQQEATERKTARLRAERLAREALERAAPPSKAKSAKAKGAKAKEA